MKEVTGIFLMALLFVSPSSWAFHIDELGASQLLVVTTSSWDAVPAEIRRYEKKDGQWTLLGPALPAVVGKRGLAWGLGLHPSSSGIAKKEGDGKAPAGIFKLTQIYGYAVQALEGSYFPYHQIKETIECVDDPASAVYNSIVDSSLKTQGVSWNSSEKMLRPDSLYKWLIVVDHNGGEKAVRGGGSCIFVHVWRDSTKGTAGCTATSEENLVQLIQWLNPEKNPLLIQLPKDIYERTRNEWGLPLI